MKFHIFQLPKPAKVLAVCVSSTKYLCLAASLSLPINSSAGIEKNMADMFNSMGAEANYSEAGAAFIPVVALMFVIRSLMSVSAISNYRQ